jgi:membrane protein
MFLLYVGAYWGNYAKLIECIGSEYKWGYWFTFVLFIMNVIHYFVSMVYAKCRKQEANSKGAIILFPLVIIAILLHILKLWDWNHNEAFYCRWMGLRLLAEHFPYYVLGIACCMFRSKWHRLINNEWIMGAAVVVFVGLQIHSGGGFYKALLIGLLGIYLLYGYCFAYQDTLSGQTFIGRQLSLIGRHTLPIYLIHYFFILGLKMPWIGEHLDPASQWWIIAIIITIMTFLIAYSSLMVRKMLSISTPLYTVLLGK